MATQCHFYVTLCNNSSRDMYEQNTQADFTVKLAQPVELGSPSNWEVGLCEISCSSTPEETLDLIYCNLISPQFVGDSTVRNMRTYVFPSSSSSSCQHDFQNVYSTSVEQRRFQNIRIEFLTPEGLHIPFEDSTTPM